MRLLLGLIVAASLGVSIACGRAGNGNRPPDATESALRTSTAVAASFDPNVLTALALQPAEVGPGLPLQPGFEQGPEGAVILDFTYGDDRYRIISTVGHASSRLDLDAALTRQRKLLLKFVGDESNYPLPGSDRAFIFSYSASEMAVIATKGDFLFAVRIRSEGQSIPQLRQQVGGYMNIALAKLTRYLEDPAAVTPVPGTIVYRPSSP